MSKVKMFTLGVTNFYVVRGDKGVIMVDTGRDSSEKLYRDFWDRARIDPREIGLLVITHGHTDHFQHAYLLREMTGAAVVCHQNAAAALRTGVNPPIAARTEMGKRVLRAIAGTEPVVKQPVEPDRVFETEFDLSPYGVAGRVVHTPGHTDCSTAVVLDSGEVIVGDTVVASPVSGKACIAYFASDEKRLFASVRRLLDWGRIFFPGHGGRCFTRAEVETALAAELRATAGGQCN
jgi:hydroxyacylglutathione hydrolase